jgi:hypothetical protein
MAGLTLAQAEAQLASYMTAETKVLQGQSYSIGSRQLTRANLQEIREGITYWNSKVNELTSGAGIRVRGITLG